MRSDKTMKIRPLRSGWPLMLVVTLSAALGLVLLGGGPGSTLVGSAQAEAKGTHDGVAQQVVGADESTCAAYTAQRAVAVRDPLTGLTPGSIEFATTSIGWLTGFRESTGTPVILKTTNGGSTWRLQCKRGAYGGALFALSQTRVWCADGVVLRTTNGRTWRRFTPRMLVFGVCFVSKSKGFAAAVQGTGAGPCALLRTGNGGASWRVCKKVDDFPAFSRPDFVGLVRGWTTRGAVVYRTTNGGRTWSKCGRLTGQDPAQGTSVDFVTRNVGWAVGTHLWKTRNGGKTWRVQDPAGISSFGMLRMQSTSTGWMENGDRDMLLRTTNGGATWRVKLHLPGASFNYDVRGRSCWVWGKDAGGHEMLLRSRDAGATWRTLH